MITPDLPQFDFESLLRLVASYSDAIVPVVSFREIHHSDPYVPVDPRDWKRLLANTINGRAEVVVCTDLDQVSQENMEKRLEIVTKAFWPSGVLKTSRVIPCSPLMDLSARDLLDRSNTTKPPFETIWEYHAVGYHVRGPLSSIPCTEQQSSAPAKF